MPRFTCYVADCNLSTGGTPPPAVTDLAPRGHPIGTYFHQASGAADLDIALDWSRRDILRPFQQTGVVSTDTLLHALPQLLGAAEASSALGLLLADRYDAASGQYGVMFDIDRNDGSSGQRQGCALFLRPIWDKFYQLPPDTGEAAFREAVAYIAVHELGHAFNLWHLAEPDNSFMQAHPAPDQLGSYQFDSQQQHYLALGADVAAADYVFPGPGREPFGTLAPGYTGTDGSPFATPPDEASGLSLRIALSHAEFWTFEPVELDLELHLPPTALAPVEVPNELDPGYPSFQIWITRPDGERFRYRAQARFCRPNGTAQIAPGVSFRRDFALSRQSGGFTFSIPGPYQIQAALRLSSSRFLLSNIAACTVRQAEPTSSAFIEAAALLQAPATQRLLRFKRCPPAYLDCARLAQFADTKATRATADLINYALGKSLLRLAALTPHDEYGNDLRNRGHTHLRRLLDAARLSPHRTRVATELLESLPGTRP